MIGYLKKQAELENPSAFMTGLSKLLPSMLEGNPDAPLIVERVYLPPFIIVSSHHSAACGRVSASISCKAGTDFAGSRHPLITP